jgi:hypothetical protein
MLKNLRIHLNFLHCVLEYSASYKRQATQITGQRSAGPHDASNAVDGKDDTCSQTIKTPRDALPWWQVDLDEKVNITFIQVKNSGRHPTSFRAYVRYDVGSDGMACGNFHVFVGDETRIIRCQPLYGRSVKIVGTTKQDSLSLCEVQVFNDSGWLTWLLFGVRGNFGSGKNFQEQRPSVSHSQTYNFH